MGDLRRDTTAGSIVVLKHGHAELFRLIGPFAMDREVHRALGQPLFSAEGMVWFIALEGRWPGHRNRAVGFAALRLNRVVTRGRLEAWYDYAFVLPEYRKKGIYSKLWERREAYVEGLEHRPDVLRLVCHRDRWHHYQERGWSESSRRGQWVYAEKPVEKITTEEKAVEHEA